ncbi:MAG TPA: peroxiredoxin family protein [Gemmataceae bacterium]|nr:peroxiredoxin family protein [Gemmataceae bacterium]
MKETLHQLPMPAMLPQGRRSKWGSASITLLVLILLAGGVGVVGRIAIQDRPPDGARKREDEARLLVNYHPEIQAGSPAGSLQKVLEHPDLIPTHNHPLLGRRAPDFELADLEGTVWKLRELLAGGPVVLVFYHTYCPLCMRQLFDGDKDLPLFREVGARVVAISADAPELMRRRLEQYGPIGFAVLSDPGNQVAQAYHVFRRTRDGKMAGRFLHGTFVIDRQGTVQWVNVGDAPFRRNPALLYQLAKIEGRLPSRQPGS